LERLDSGLRACAAGGGRRRSGDTSSPISGKTPYIGSTRYRYIAILYTHRTRHRVFYGPDIRIFRYFLQYWDHIGHDIVEKPDIWFGKERVCPDIVPISALILPISGQMTRYRVLMTLSENSISGHTLISVRVLSRYLGRYGDIISRLVLNFFSRQVFLQGTNTIIQMMMMMI
jgi:hypothetical protein